MVSTLPVSYENRLMWPIKAWTVLSSEMFPIDPVREKEEPPVDRWVVHPVSLPLLELMHQARNGTQSSNYASDSRPTSPMTHPSNSLRDSVMPGHEVHDPEGRLHLLPGEGSVPTMEFPLLRFDCLVELLSELTTASVAILSRSPRRAGWRSAAGGTGGTGAGPPTSHGGSRVAPSGSSPRGDAVLDHRLIGVEWASVRPPPGPATGEGASDRTPPLRFPTRGTRPENVSCPGHHRMRNCLGSLLISPE